MACDPRYANAWFNKAQAEERSGQLGDAVRSYERFLALAPVGNAMRVEYARGCDFAS